MTSARIAIQLENGKILSIRCLQDGQPSHLGRILWGWFASTDSLWSLLLGGDVSTIQTHSSREEIIFGKHSYAALYDSEEQYRVRTEEEYHYLLHHNGSWHVSEGGSPFIPLERVLVDAT